jgi:hypothetical protein
MSNPGLDKVLAVTAEEIDRGFLETLKEQRDEIVQKIGQEKYDRIVAQLERDIDESSKPKAIVASNS